MTSYDRSMQSLGRIFLQSPQDNIIAAAGGAQANATAITAPFARVTTAVTSGDSVALPKSDGGMVVFVVNASPNPVTVYGYTVLETVNGAASAAQPGSSVSYYACVTAGQWTVGAGAGAVGQLVYASAQNNIAAFAGGGQASATQLTSQNSRITTVATAGDSVKLPAAVAGLNVQIVNTGVNPMNVFGLGSDLVNGQASVSQLPNSIDIYVCVVSGQWSVEAGVGYAGSLFTESAQNGLVAFAGGGQAGATAITTQTTRVTTVATFGDSVKLPPAVAGLELIVINTGVSMLAVFGAGTDLVNNQASINQPPNSIDVYACPIAGQWFVETGVGFAGSLFTESAQNGITAFAGGGQGSATQLTTQTSRITTVATAGDSIKLPVAAPGLELMVINRGANSMQVFGAGTDTVDGQPFATGVSQMQSSLVIYVSVAVGTWETEGLATGFGGPGLQTQSTANGLTALGTNQATALVLNSMISRITTTATGTGVVLPAAVAGLIVTVSNRGLNPLAVYGAGADVINGISSISMPANSTGVFVTGVAGQWECEGVGAGFSGNLPTVSTTNGITATAAGTQGTALQLTTVINRITVVATAADAVKLPPAIAGLQVTIYNAAAANSANVFPNTGDAINALGANTAFALVANKNATFGSAVNGQWHAILSA